LIQLFAGCPAGASDAKKLWASDAKKLLGRQYHTFDSNGLIIFEKNRGNHNLYLDIDKLYHHAKYEKHIPIAVINAILVAYSVPTSAVFNNFIKFQNNIPSNFNQTNNNIDIKHDISQISTTLYEYEIQASVWMKNVECNIDLNNLQTYEYFNTPTIYTHSDFITTNNKHVYIDKRDTPLSKIIILNDETEDDINNVNANQHEMKKMQTRGGILGDEMGIGKTLMMLTLILINPLKHAIPMQNEHKMEHAAEHKHNRIDPYIHSTYPICKTTLVICPSHLVMEWEREIKKHFSPLPKFHIICTKHDHVKLTYKDILDADIIIASDTFLNGNSYRDLTRTTFLESNNDTNNDMNNDTNNYDNDELVINEIIINENENENDNNFPKNKTYLINTKINPKSKCYGFRELQLGKIEPLTITQPMLHYFKWRRIIIDEGHTLLKKQQMREMLKLLRSSYRWYVSGSTFSSNTDLKYIAEFLKWNNQSENYEPFLTDYYLSRSKASVQHILELPSYEEIIEYIVPTNIEQRIYDACKLKYSEINLRKICCHIQVCSEYKSTIIKSLYELERKTVADNETLIEELQVKLCKNDEQLGKIYDVLYVPITELDYVPITESDFVPITDIKDSCEHRIINTLLLPDTVIALEKNIVELEKTKKHIYEQIRKIKNFTEYMKNTLEELKLCKNQCNICLDVLENNTNIKGKVTKCGHFYCEPCIKQHLSDLNKQWCPYCRAHLTIEDGNLYDVGLDIDNILNTNEIILPIPSNPPNPQNPTIPQITESVSKLTIMYGSKIAFLINYLKSLEKTCPNYKVVIFSQWKEMLRMIGDVLDVADINIKNVYCNGTITHKNKAINDFREKPNIHVMMLSLKSLAAGLNITHATHLFFMDTMKGSIEDVAKIEKQAIARLHRIGQQSNVKIIRLIMKNTIEHEIHNFSKKLY
jgi:SNF2 family DNA or RNA helicase